ncbi:MAG: cytochrome c biogenesis protein [Dehalococcoidia bacterium]
MFNLKEFSWRSTLMIVAAILMLITLALIFLWVPTEKNLGVSQRIFYYHVPIAWIGMLSIIIVAISSVVYLIRDEQSWDAVALAAAEIGVILMTGVIITGAIWGKLTWGVWWTWDPKLTTTLILWFIFVAYLLMRARASSSIQGARIAAFIALIGAIDAPVIYMSTIWWRTTHPGLNIGPLAEQGSLDFRMGVTILFSVLTFSVFFTYILIERFKLRKSELIVEGLYNKTV